MKPRVIINAGHSVFDPGVMHGGKKESAIAMGLRDEIVHKLGERYDFISVPDTINLRDSIAWINRRANVNDVAFSIHFNSHSNRTVRGTEAYYYNQREGELAAIYSREISEALGIPNRGAKPDRYTWVGSLGWVRQLKCDSVLIEFCYITNPADMRVFNYGDALKGVERALDEIIPRKETDLKKIETQIEALKRRVEALMRTIMRLLANRK